MAFTDGDFTRFTNTDITDDEIIGAGNGATTVFNYTTDHLEVFLDSLIIDYTIAATGFQATSDSAGVITGTNITSGTVDKFGVIDITFTIAPDNATNVVLDQYRVLGFFQTLIDYVTSPRFDENVGTGDGVATVFSGTLANGPIAKGQCRVQFRISTVTYDVWDDGLGDFIHPEITIGTIDYVTKAINFTFANPIDNTFTVDMLYTDGTVEGRDWIAMLGPRPAQDSAGNPVTTNSEFQEIVIKNSGVSFQETIVVGFREWGALAQNQFGINLNLHISYDFFEEQIDDWNSPGFKISYDNTKELYTNAPNLYMNDDVAKHYWIYTNKRRIYVRIRASTARYMDCYSGGGIRFASPSNYPNPNIIMGNATAARLFTDSNLNDIINSGTGSGTTRWYYISQSNTFLNPTSTRLLPRTDYVDQGILKLTTENKIVLYPMYVFFNTDQELLFQIDGVYHVPFVNLSSEDTIDASGQIYVVFQDIELLNYDYFMCIRED